MNNNNNIREYTAESDINEITQLIEKVSNIVDKIENGDYSKYTHISYIKEFNSVKFDKSVQFKFNMVVDGYVQYLDGPFAVCDSNQNYIIGSYKNGKLHGEYKHWKSNNLVTCNYKYGKLHGRYFIYSLITGYHIVDKNYKNNKLHGEYKYYINGILYQVRNYVSGKVNYSFIEYYNNGNKKIVGTYINSMYYGKITKYNEDGSIKEIYWKNGKGGTITEEKFITLDAKNNQTIGFENILFV